MTRRALSSADMVDGYGLFESDRRTYTSHGE